MIDRKPRVGILDHAGSAIGGAQYVNACIAECLSPNAEVDYIHAGSGYRLGDLTRSFALDLGAVRERVVPWLANVPSFRVPGHQSIHRQVLTSRTLTQAYDLFIYSGLNIPPFCFAKAGLAYVHFPMDRAPSICGETGSLLHRVKHEGYRVVWRAQRSTYNLWLANSRYTADWVSRRWTLSAPVVYPPVEVEFPAVEKRNRIVSIGRFTGGKRSKHQLEQVRTFRRVHEKIGTSWELCLIGFCSKASEDRQYLEAVKQAAAGLPVQFVLDADRRTALKEVAEARLFWHTTGLEVDESEWPELAEHFGIATVEAMRAGCVPIVIASGGQREIIHHGESGLLVNNLIEMADASIRIADDPARLLGMSEAAMRRSLLFTKQAFQTRITSLVSKYLR